MTMEKFEITERYVSGEQTERGDRPGHGTSPPPYVGEG
jgi:hypothetical protein